MDRIFSTHGIPCIVRSDNGPPFTSDEIKKYIEENGIKHCKTPLWPQANSEAENFMKPLTKAAHTEGKVWKKHLHKFLLRFSIFNLKDTFPVKQREVQLFILALNAYLL